MKKIFKSISIICLMLIMLCPLALVGCDKHYTIDIDVVEGKGFVYLKDVEGISVVGDNAVDAGEKFEYYIVPRAGYRISKIVVDGKEQTNYSDTGAYLNFEDVKEDHNVDVYFIKTNLVVTFYCVSASGSFEVFKYVEVNDGGYVNLNETTNGGGVALWYRKDGTQNIYIYNHSTDINASKDDIDVNSGLESNILYVRNVDAEIYCDKTADELIAMGVTR